MGRTIVAGAAAIGIALVAGSFLWLRGPEPTSEPIDRDVKVVRGTGSSDTDAAPRGDHAPTEPAARGPESVRVEASGTGIPDDAALQASLPDPAAEPRALYQRVRAETRDATWAARSEQSIRAAMTALPYVRQDGLRVSCASTVCEIRGTMPQDLSIDNANVGMQAIQGEKLHGSFADAGLQTAMTSVGSSDRTPTFTIYATRR